MSQETERAEQFAALSHELDPVWKEGFELWGHGTNLADAQAILESGLLSRSPDLAPRTISVSNTKADIELLMDWPHPGTEAVLFFYVPQRNLSNPTSNYDEGLWETVPNADSYKIPSEKIPGYLDAKNLKFVKNPRFAEFKG